MDYLASDPIGPNNKFEQFNFGVSMSLGNGRLLTSVRLDKNATGAKAKGFGATYSTCRSAPTHSFRTSRNNELGRFGHGLFETDAECGPARFRSIWAGARHAASVLKCEPPRTAAGTDGERAPEGALFASQGLVVQGPM